MQEWIAMDDRESRITFRRLTRDDFPQMLEWLGDPDVSPWYTAEELSPEGMEREFGEIIDGTDPVDSYIVVIDGIEAGYIQSYRLGDHPEYLTQLDLEPDNVSSDLFIGHPGYRNHGWGTPLLRAFLTQKIFGEFRATRASIMPNPNNARAIRVYERVGFKPARVLPIRDTHTGKIEDELIMLLSRDNFFASKQCP
jgi:RimJ/RimL family protein N-acetyltransferase